MTAHRSLLITGAFSGFLSVALGAFGAHALREVLPADLLTIFDTGVRYHMLHAVAIVVCAMLAPSLRRAALAGWCFAGGTVIFSGSLYVLAVTGVRALGAITPIGGVLFLAGWTLLAFAAIRRA
jgi:uncharacterized membrane protein YgdD (TMEM256/DUF423 family)